jgi:hypothetical protein
MHEVYKRERERAREYMLGLVVGEVSIALVPAGVPRPWVSGLGFRVQGLGLRVQGPGFRV